MRIKHCTKSVLPRCRCSSSSSSRYCTVEVELLYSTSENVGKTFHRQTHVLPTLAVMIMVVVVVVVVMTMTVMRVVIGKK